ncbi:hypothetical protein EIP91_007730 [Steccherinum ochraceum]|uniref:Glycoside hydrolase family 71 protein n=1 Tax=Steccherinum ochraceum TaxID=92696 RepID=A0A4R0RQB9_9APHY|nr:hypothetical protein EIP91_007730 [Steccherinum ochraceum]
MANHKPKIVVAHFMVGNTYPYTANEWRKDIQLASEHGFDGFALNVGKEDWQFDRVGDAFEAAEQLSHTLKREFTMFMSFDMASIPSASRSDISHIQRYVSAFARHPCCLQYEGGVVVSTFAGEGSFFGFGEGNLDEAWGWVKQELRRSIGKEIHFIPSFFINPTRYPTLRCLDGYFHWNGGWPIHLTSTSPRREVRCPRLDSDAPHLYHLPVGKTYMAAVSPWFFTHYGKDSWNKNWTYRGDDHLLVRRWEHLMSIRDQVDIVQVISWNDYGESHYLAPPLGAQPNSESWVNSCPHDALLSLNAYFIHVFKRGRYPHEVDSAHTTPQEKELMTRDVIWMWARPHLREAVAREDDVGRPDGWDLTDDTFWVVALASNPCLLIVSSGSGSADPHRRAYNLVTSGIHKFSHPMAANASMRAEMIRDGECVALCDPGATAGFKISDRPETYNFNAFERPDLSLVKALKTSTTSTLVSCGPCTVDPHPGAAVTEGSAVLVNSVPALAVADRLDYQPKEPPLPNHCWSEMTELPSGDAVSASTGRPDVPIEIWEKIIDCVRGGTAMQLRRTLSRSVWWEEWKVPYTKLRNARTDLAACCLVCRAWVSRCRYHLFQLVSLRSASDVTHLVQLLTQSPALRRRMYAIHIDGRGNSDLSWIYTLPTQLEPFQRNSEIFIRALLFQQVDIYRLHPNVGRLFSRLQGITQVYFKNSQYTSFSQFARISCALRTSYTDITDCVQVGAAETVSPLFAGVPGGRHLTDVWLRAPWEELKRIFRPRDWSLVAVNLQVVCLCYTKERDDEPLLYLDVEFWKEILGLFLRFREVNLKRTAWTKIRVQSNNDHFGVCIFREFRWQQGLRVIFTSLELPSVPRLLSFLSYPYDDLVLIICNNKLAEGVLTQSTYHPSVWQPLDDALARPNYARIQKAAVWLFDRIQVLPTKHNCTNDLAREILPKLASRTVLRACNGCIYSG